MSTSLKSALKSSAMIVALWAPTYFVLVESFGLESMPRSELFQWGLVAVGDAPGCLLPARVGSLGRRNEVRV